MATKRITKLADLLAVLGEGNVPYRGDVTRGTVEIPVTTPPLSGTLYIRWEQRLPYVQIVHPFVTDVPPARVHEVETAVCRANSLIALPGLGYEHPHRFVYMRLCVPLYDEGMLASSFQRQMMAVLQNAKDFIGPFREIVAGHPGADVVGLAVKYKVEFDPAGQSMPQA